MFLGTPVRKTANKFAFSLTYSYLCSLKEKKKKRHGTEELQENNRDLGTALR